MKTKMMKRTMAVALSATMVMGMSVNALAADTTTGTTGTAPIYSFDVEDVVVPTKFVTAFNPDGLTVNTGGSTTSTDQVLSQNYGILNKSSKDKLVTVELKVTDENTGAEKVTFVDTDDEVTSADKETYAMHLIAIPADTTEVQVGDTPASADESTDATALGKVTMTKAADGKEVTLKAGNNHIGFKLDKATYSPISGSEVTLGTTETNDVTANYEITAVAGAGKGITAFTFGGKLNEKADWTKLASGIKLEATYSFANAETTDTVISGTGAMIEVSKEPTFTTGTEIGVIDLAVGLGDKAFASIVKVTGPWQGSDFDLTSFVTVADDKSNITIDQETLGGWATNGINPTISITYMNASGEEKEATVVLLTYDATN